MNGRRRQLRRGRARVARAGHRRRLASARAAVAGDRRDDGDGDPVGARRPEEAEGSARRGAGAHRADPERLRSPRRSAATRCAPRATLARRRSAASRSRCSRRRSLVLLLTTTVPLVYLAWTSLHRIDLGMPWLSGFAGARQLREDGQRPALLEFAAADRRLHGVDGRAAGGRSACRSRCWCCRSRAGRGCCASPRSCRSCSRRSSSACSGARWCWRPTSAWSTWSRARSASAATTGSAIPQLALISVIAIHTWQWTPFAFLVLLATLSTLPPDVYEAARLDRAGAWQRFLHITLPLIRPAIVMVVIMRTMMALSAFAAIFAATGGGPGIGDGDPQPLRVPHVVHRAAISATARRSRSCCWRSRSAISYFMFRAAAGAR